METPTNTYRDETAQERDPVLEQQVQPIGNRLFCRPITRDEELKGGIVIPDSAQDSRQEAEVIAAGPGRMTPEGYLVPTAVKPGTRVLLPKHAGTKIEIKGVQYIIIEEPQVLAVVGKPEGADDDE